MVENTISIIFEHFSCLWQNNNTANGKLKILQGIYLKIKRTIASTL